MGDRSLPVIWSVVLCIRDPSAIRLPWYVSNGPSPR